MEKLAMGQYGLYVWSSYGLALAVLVISTVQARRRQRSVFRDVAKRLETTESKR